MIFIRILAHTSNGLNLVEYPMPSMNSIIRLMWVVVFITITLYVYFHLRHGINISKKKDKASKKLLILETRSLGNRQFLMVVAYKKEKFLLGIHPNGIQFLSKINDKNEDA